MAHIVGSVTLTCKDRCAWIYEAIGGLPSTWVVKTKNKIPRIVQWKPMASSRINFADVYSFFNDESRIGDVLQTLEPNSKESSRKYWLTVKDYMPNIPDWVHKHQPSINAMPSVSRQSDDHDEHDDIPNPTPEQRHDTYEDEVAFDDHQEQTHADSNDAHDSEFNDYVRRRLDKIDRNVYELKSELKDFKETVVGFIDTFSTRPNKDSPTGCSYALFNMFVLANGQAPDDYGVHTDVFPEVPPGVSKFGRAYIPSYVYNSPYMIPPLRRGKNARPIPRPQIMDHAQDMNTSVDINPLRGLEDSSLFAEFDRWFAGDMTVVWRVQHPRSFFEILLGLTSMGWLGDKHIHEYLRLISEKQRQYPNALVQRVTHTDTFFWLWNNGDCAVDSLVFDDRLNSYLCGRQHTMSKSMTDVDMICILLIPVNLDGAHWVVARVDFWKNKVWIYNSLLTFRDDKRYKLKFKPLKVIFPRWLEYVGFYNIRPEFRSANPWKVMAVKSAPQQEPETGDCGFICNTSYTLANN
ncbi:hypothetical protein CUMW_219090 [Citrus unshiu]|uniref:Ubiquitin-like protease family profile domain-containing protein n=1 Tax=Citrus unshiu TaxID=55188 RepID=A0A2H5QD86_CITUN|nr:hypothetical protein CUMW_219090 [Citrus unshiu]